MPLLPHLPWRLFVRLSLAEWRHHPWRHAAAWLAVALGVALAFSVHLINASALSEFAQAVRSVNGEPDLTLSARQRDGLDERWLDTLLADPDIAEASPVLEADAPVQAGSRIATFKLTGVDALRVAALAPGLMPRPETPPAAASAPAGDDRLAVIDPQAVYANPAALERLASLGAALGDTLHLPGSPTAPPLRVAGTVSAGGGALLVMDVAALQAWLGPAGRLSRIDLRFAPGVSRAAWLAAHPLPADVQALAPQDREQRVSNLSRAYRVNLTVLALVALLVGGFLVYSVVALGVAQRTPSLALLGVLGLAARERQALVLAETAALGLFGSAVGLALGTGLAWAALRLLGGDLGGGYFPGVTPALQWSAPAAAAYAALGTAAAVLGAWWPARHAQALQPAQALKGLGSLAAPRARLWPAVLLLAAGAVLALMPPWFELPLAAYAAVAAWLAGGVIAVPALVEALLARVHPRRAPLALLAVERARFARHTASATVAGVVASLALSVALTVMVASFRDAVTQWLDSVLPADLYLRSASSALASDQTVLGPEFTRQVAALPGVRAVQATRLRAMQIHPQRPAVALLARELGPDPARALPLLGPLQPLAAGEIGVYVSEPAAALYGWQPGQRLTLPLPRGDTPVVVRAVWRDYARQFGAVVMAQADWRAVGGDDRVNDLALWLAPGASAAEITEAARAFALPLPLESATTAELRRLSLAIFDRSFAVTQYLQAVAIGVGLVGIAASLSAQVLARRREFGLLRHLGLTRRQVVATVAAEAALWLAGGLAMGLALGVAISAVLVFVVNPQSFHWTMDLRLPPARLAALCAAVFVAGLATAWLSARRAASQDAVLAVKEDW